MRTAVLLAATIPLPVAADTRGQTRTHPAEPPLPIDTVRCRPFQQWLLSPDIKESFFSRKKTPWWP
jgi:hypothetical protein